MQYLKITVFLLLLCAMGSSCTFSENNTYQDLNVTEFKTKMNDPNVILLDVRTPAETAEGKIEGALEINIQDANFQQQVEALDKGKTYLVYCKSGGRSARACSAMQEMGFTELYNLEGGFTAFSAE